MSLFKEASLVMIPSGVKDGTLYSIKPEDGAGDFTFTRGANLAATRVDENGLIEKGRENLLLQSNTFSTTWTASNLTPTSGQTGYDGSSDAWLLTRTVSGGRIQQSISVSGVQTLSVYAKAGSLNFLYISPNSSTLQWFDLANGILGSSTLTPPIDANIESIGGGWYRCSVTSNITPSAILIYPAEFDATGSGATGSIYIQDAQLELGLVATDYIETGATTEQAGILENLPRLDYTDSSCPSLLLEPTRQNSLPYSEYFKAWNEVDATVTTNVAISPDGSQNASTLDVSVTTSRVAYALSLGAGTYTMSCYVRSDTPVNMLLLLVVDGSNSSYAFTTSAEWTRYNYTFTAASSVTVAQIRSNQATSGTVEIYGAQLEVGSYPTSYIPTYGTSVTRSGDVCVGAGDATTFNDAEGVLFVEMSALSDLDTTSRYISISDGTANNILRIIYAFDGSLSILQTGSTLSSSVYFANPNLSENVKIAVKYGNLTSDYKVYINGVNKTLLSFTASPMTGLNSLDFSYPPSTSPFYGNIKKAIVFPTALTDTELEALTTI